MLVLALAAFSCKGGDPAPTPAKYGAHRYSTRPLGRLNSNAVSVAKKTMPGVVHIYSLRENPKPIFLTLIFSGMSFSKAVVTWIKSRFVTTYVTLGTGSGFLINERGYILTNHHVINGADKIMVKFADDPASIEGEKLGDDPLSDVALVKVAGDYRRRTLALGDSDQVDVGEWVAAIGNPYDVGETFTVGVVSALGRDDIGMLELEDFIQTDAAINPGNSGGPLVNENGEVIGINSIMFTDASHIGLAVPINIAKAILPKLVNGERVDRGMIGVNFGDMTPELAMVLGVSEGALVSSVRVGSPAQKAGIRPGDVITGFDGNKVTDYHVLKRLVVSMPAGDMVDVRLFRAGKTIRVKLRLAKFERPQ